MHLKSKMDAHKYHLFGFMHIDGKNEECVPNMGLSKWISTKLEPQISCNSWVVHQATPTRATDWSSSCAKGNSTLKVSH